MEQLSLSRNLGLFSVTMIGVGGMIGAGIFALTGIAAGVAGAAVVLVFVLNGLLVLPTAMAYAELSAALPRAGGGYALVQEGLGGVHGFLAGWMSLFAYIAAGALYALAFGRFAAEAWMTAGLPAFGLTVEQLEAAWMVLAILGFAGVNLLGVTETARVGNVVTLAKIIVLGVFVVAGLWFLASDPVAISRITGDFLPNGIAGVLAAMGLAYIAFEGFEIIAQSGEEIRNPKVNLPRAIFLSIGVVLILYVGVAVVTFGVISPPAGSSPHAYLGELKEMAVVEAARRVFAPGIGGLLLLLSGLAATTSALNVAMYSASRVAFAMGREGHLPAWTCRLHPERRTPIVAVAVCATLMLLMASALPIEKAAAAGSLMFLFLFMQINAALLASRRNRPELHRPYRAPWYPLLPLAAIGGNGLLALHLFQYSPRAWYAASAWMLLGTLLYYARVATKAAHERHAEVLFQVVQASSDFSVLLAIERKNDAAAIARLGALIAKSHKGEILALHVIRVPRPLGLSEGRRFVTAARERIAPVARAASRLQVPLHTVIRLGRDVVEAIRDTAVENRSNLLLLRYTPSGARRRHRLFGTIIDPLLAQPPCDVVVAHVPHRIGVIRRILVPVRFGPACKATVRFALGIAAAAGSRCRVVLLHVTPSKQKTQADFAQAFSALLGDEQGSNVECRIKSSRSVVNAILDMEKGFDLVVLGATAEPLFRRLLLGNVSKRLLRQAIVPTLVLKPAGAKVMLAHWADAWRTKARTWLARYPAGEQGPNEHS